MGWCHGDVKAENMVLGEDRTYLVDLGLARKVGECLNKRAWGTAGYIDPLIMWYARTDEDLNMAARFDWWSAGMVLVYMLVRGDYTQFDRVAKIAAGYYLAAADYASFMRLEKVREILEPEVAAVVAPIEQKLWQRGKLQQGVKLVAVREGLLRMVEGLLQGRQENRWSGVEVLDMKRHLVGLMVAAIR
jgi:hypothetical protein